MAAVAGRRGEGSGVWSKVVLLALVAAVIAAGGAWLLWSEDSTDTAAVEENSSEVLREARRAAGLPPDQPAADPAAGPALPAEVQELLVLIEQGAGTSFTAHYELLEPGTEPSTVVIHNTPTHYREDSTSADGTQTRLLLSPSQNLACRLVEDWSCARGAATTTRGLLSPPRADQLLGAPAEVGGAEIADIGASCLRVGEDYEHCVSAEGIPLRIRVAETAIEAVSLDHELPEASAFDPPAQP